MSDTVLDARVGPRSYGLAVAAIMVFAVALRFPALEMGFLVDDYAQLAMMRGSYPVERAPLSLFSFSSGEPQEVRALVDSGFFPWWSKPDLRLSMLRPLSSALMWLDFSLFGDDAFAYHLHTLAWWLAMVGALAVLLYRSLPALLALLAVAFYCLDETHTMLLGWVALRNEVVATCLALWSLVVYVGYVQRGTAAHGVLAGILFALALSAGEYALPLIGYFAAAALYLPTSGPEPRTTTRLVRLLPVAVPAAVFLIVRRVGGFGAYGSQMYLDPLREPSAFAAASLARLPAIGADLVFGLRSDFWATGLPGYHVIARQVEGLLVRPLQPFWNLQWSLGVASLCALALLVRAALSVGARRPELGGRALSVFALGLPVAMIPGLAAYPSSRLLAGPLIGFSVLVAFVVYWAGRSQGYGPRLAATALALYHLVVPGLQTREEALHARALARAVRGSILGAPLGQRASDRDVLLLGAADPTTTIYIPLLREFHGVDAPRSCHLVAASFAPHHFERVADDAFILTRTELGLDPGDMYGAAFNRGPLETGFSARAGRMRVEVLDVVSGVPIRTRHELDVSLDDESLLFLQQTPLGLTRFVPPAVGDSIKVAGPMVPFSPSGESTALRGRARADAEGAR